jgi:hypothetical protein
MTVHRVITAWGHHGKARHDPWRHTPVVLVILGIAARTHQQTAIGLHHFKHRAQIIEVVLVALRPLEQGVTAE